MSIEKRKLGPATQMVHGGAMRSGFGETSEAMFLTQGFVYDSAEAAEARFKGEDDGFVYSRYANPTVSMFEERMCLLEGAEAAKATASGMAAVAASILCQVQAGDHVVSSRALFGSCRWIIEVLLPSYGVETTMVDGTNPKAWEEAVRPNTKVLFFESPTNPTLEVIDIVVYSTTKHIDGQGRCLGGVILADQEWIDEKLYDYYRHTGPSMSPFNAWVMLKGLETLPLRVGQQTSNARAVADFLAEQKNIKRVIYPGRPDHPQANIIPKQMKGGSTLICFELHGGKRSAFAMENALEIIKLSNNLGDSKSLITHPATTTHKNLSEEDRDELGITDGTVRLSVGLEDSADLVGDLEQALAKAS